jgi:hypothetical protein
MNMASAWHLRCGERPSEGEITFAGSYLVAAGSRPFWPDAKKAYENNGAGDEIRTHDPNLGKVVLYL